MGTDRRNSGNGRPYAKLAIGQLEGMFAAGRTDRALLPRLEHELSFRATERAARLRSRVEKARAAMPDVAAAAPPRKNGHRL